MPKIRRPIEEADPLEDDEAEIVRRMQKITPDDPVFDAWLKQKYGYNPYKKKTVKVKRAPSRTRRS